MVDLSTFEKDTYHRRFKLFLKVNRERQMYKELYIIETGSAFGIAVSNNIHAVRWRSIEWREEQLKAFLEGRRPNYGYASHLRKKQE